jgi:hypothetical protein
MIVPFNHLVCIVIEDDANKNSEDFRLQPLSSEYTTEYSTFREYLVIVDDATNNFEAFTLRTVSIE